MEINNKRLLLISIFVAFTGIAFGTSTYYINDNHAELPGTNVTSLNVTTTGNGYGSGLTQYKTGTTTYSAATTGVLAVTGIGFKPKALQITSDIATTSNVSWGMTDGVQSQVEFQFNNVGQFTNDVSGNIVYMGFSGTDYARATFTSFDDDGFTITRYTLGSPSGTVRLQYIAYR